MCVRIVLRVVVVAILILQVALVLANPLVVILVVGAAHHKPLLIVYLKEKSQRTSLLKTHPYLRDEVVGPCAPGPLLQAVELEVAPKLD